MSLRTTSYGPLRPLTNTKTPHGQHSTVNTSKQAANKINIQPRQKANNFKLKRESWTESKGERESIPVLAGSPPLLGSRREALRLELRSRREALRLELGSRHEALRLELRSRREA